MLSEFGYEVGKYQISRILRTYSLGLYVVPTRKPLGDMQLYDRLQKIVNDTFNGFTDRNNEIHLQLADLEKDVINHTKTCMTRKDKSAGNLIRTTNDANIINNASSQFFTLVNDMCHAVGLASGVPIIPSNSIKRKYPRLQQKR
jgi:hypothetical protein